MNITGSLLDYYASLRLQDPLLIILGLSHAIGVAVYLLTFRTLIPHTVWLVLNGAFLVFWRKIHIFLSDNQPLMGEKHMISRPYFNDTGYFVQRCILIPNVLYSGIFAVLQLCYLVRRIRSLNAEPGAK